MAEETQRPARNVPNAMVGSMSLSYFFGYIVSVDMTSLTADDHTAPACGPRRSGQTHCVPNLPFRPYPRSSHQYAGRYRHLLASHPHYGRAASCANASDVEIRLFPRPRQCHAVFGADTSDQRCKGPGHCELGDRWAVRAVLSTRHCEQQDTACCPDRHGWHVDILGLCKFRRVVTTNPRSCQSACTCSQVATCSLKVGVRGVCESSASPAQC